MIVRRTVTVLAAAILMVLGGHSIAGAAFSDTTSAMTTTVKTVTVQPPTSVRVETSCTTTTVETKRTYQVDPYTGTTTQVGYSQSTTMVTSKSNVESDTTVRTEGPGTNQYTITSTVKDTELYATLRWNSSTSPRVTGYRMTAWLNNGYAVGMGDAAVTATSMTGQYDASVTNYDARLSMVTLTSYGWTATSDLSNPVRC